MARANSLEKLNESPLPILNLTQINEFLDNRRSNLDLEELLVVIYERNDSILSTIILVLISGHCMIEIQIYPLTHVKFILIIMKTDQGN